jgi:type I restriction enzyme S subunit
MTEQVTSLGRLGKTYGGLTGKSKNDFGNGNASYVTFMDIIANVRVVGDRLDRVRVPKSERQNCVLRGDLLFNGSSETPEDVALSAVVATDLPDRTFLNSFCFGYRLNEADDLLAEYLAYFFRSSKGRALVLSLAQGATRYNIAKTKFMKLEIDLPDGREVERTVVALRDCDGLMSSLERLITKKQAMKQGVIQQLLTGKTRLPGFGAPWAEVRLGDHVTYIKTVPLSRAQLDTCSPLRYLHYGDIHTSPLITLDAAHLEMPRAKAILAGSAGKLQVGDLVFADASEDVAGVGKSVEVTSVPKDGVVPGLHTIAARFDPMVLADGFKAYLQFNTQFRASLLRLAAGTKVLATTRSYISGTSLLVPGVEEQRAIAAVLSDANTEIQLLQRRLEKAREIKQGMMQELLTGRTRLVSQGALV